MYLLTDTTPEAVEALTSTLDGLGDSLLVVGGPDLWNVHVHVDDPGAAVEAGVAAGRPERIRITHFASQVDDPRAAGAAGRRRLRRRARASARCCARPVPSWSPPGPAGAPRPGSCSQAVESTGSTAVVLLPGDRDTLMAAEIAAQAAAGAGIDVHVVPARTTVQALAALAVLDPGRSVHANVVAMTSAAVATRHGAVSVATKEALTWAGVCHPGDVLGIVDGDVAFLGTDVAVAAREVLDRLLSAGGELVTLVVGAEAEPGLGERRRGGPRARPPRARGRRHRRRPAGLPPPGRGGVSGGDLTWRPSRASSRRSSPRRPTQFAKARDIHTVGDLLAFWPRRYRTRDADLGTAEVGKFLVGVAEVKSASTRPMQKRKGTMLNVVITDGAPRHRHHLLQGVGPREGAGAQGARHLRGTVEAAGRVGQLAEYVVHDQAGRLVGAVADLRVVLDDRGRELDLVGVLEVAELDHLPVHVIPPERRLRLRLRAVGRVVARAAPPGRPGPGWAA